jgi:hypothetical protein
MAYFWDLWKHAGIKFMEHIGIYGLMWLLWYIMIHLIRDKLAVSYPMYPAWFFFWWLHHQKLGFIHIYPLVN